MIFIDQSRTPPRVTVDVVEHRAMHLLEAESHVTIAVSVGKVFLRKVPEQTQGS